MTVRFVGDLLVLAAVLFAGYVGGFRVGRQRRPYWSAPPCEGFVVEVFDVRGMILWQSVGARETAYSIAESWDFPGYAVMVASPGDQVKDIVYGAELLDEWESIWPLDEPSR